MLKIKMVKNLLKKRNNKKRKEQLNQKTNPPMIRSAKNSPKACVFIP